MRKKKEPNPIYDKEGYKEQLLRLQKSEVLHMIDSYDFTVTELIAAMWDSNMVRLLREVAPYAAEQTHTEDFSYQGRFRLTVTHVTRGLLSNPDRPLNNDRHMVGFSVFYGDWSLSPLFWVA